MQQPWRFLQKHDKVRIIAPGAASPVNPERATHWEDLERGCDLLRSWDLEPVYSPTLFGELPSYYNFSHSDAARYADFVDASQSDAAAIWAFRGGYGSDRIVRTALENSIQPRDAKLLIGFSDVTCLHSFCHVYWQWSTLHALTLRQLGLQLVNSDDIEKTRQLIVGETRKLTLPLVPLNDHAKESRTLSANIHGGNLTIMQATLGTPWQIPIENSILLCEDVGEAPYRIARIFQQFLAAGHLGRAAAVVLGDFTPETNMDLVVAELAAYCPVPLLQYAGIGHGKKNQPIPLGRTSTLMLGESPRLEISL